MINKEFQQDDNPLHIKQVHDPYTLNSSRFNTNPNIKHLHALAVYIEILCHCWLVLASPHNMTKSYDSGLLRSHGSQFELCQRSAVAKARRQSLASHCAFQHLKGPIACDEDLNMENLQNFWVRYSYIFLLLNSIFLSYSDPCGCLNIHCVARLWWLRLLNSVPTIGQWAFPWRSLHLDKISSQFFS